MNIKRSAPVLSAFKPALTFIVLLLCVVETLPFIAFAYPAETADVPNPKKVVRVGWFESSYNFKDASGRRTGYAYDYQRKVAAYTGWKYEYVEGSWNELLNKLFTGEIDMLSGVSYTEERSKNILFPNYAMGTEEYYLYINNEQINEFDDNISYFNGKKIGVNKGSIQLGLLQDWSEKFGVNVDIVEVTGSGRESIEMLVTGKLDGYISLDNYISGKDIIPVAKIGSSEFYLALSKSRSDLLSELESALSNIQDENRYYSMELHNKYIKNAGANMFLSAEEKDWLEENPTIKVGYLDNYLAYCSKDDFSGKLTGALKDYLDKASACFANGSFEYEAVSFNTVEQALDALQTGEVDCIFPTNLSDYDGEEKGIIITPALTRAALYTVVKSSEQDNFANRLQSTVAIIDGDTNYESIMNDIYPSWYTVQCDNIDDCMKAVAENRADCFLISSYRYNSIRKMCEKYGLSYLDTGKDIPFCFAVKNGSKELYSILAKTTNIIPTSYINNILSHYYSEEGQNTLIDVIMDNIVIVIAVIAVIIAMLMMIIFQSRLIKAEKKANEQLRIAEELSKRVYVDALTSVRNKSGYLEYIQKLQNALELDKGIEFAVVMFDCDDLKYINDKFGHEKGDEYLKTAARLICQVFRHSPVFRIGGDEFISVLENEDYKNRKALLEEFNSDSEAINEAANYDWEKINVSLGIAEFDPNTDSTVEATASRADQVMYENKRKRKAGRAVR